MTNAKVRKALNLDRCGYAFVVDFIKRKHVGKRRDRWN
jgi:hypothetical protein